MTGAVEGRLAEAWVKVRGLHSPESVPDSVSVLSNAIGKMTVFHRSRTECSHCRLNALSKAWPCPTARIVYGPREIAAALAGTPAQTEDGE